VVAERRVWVPLTAAAAGTPAPAPSSSPSPSSPSPAAGGRWAYEYGVTNVEYTEFERLGLSDEAVSAGSKTSVFPANTNVLYVGLQAARGIVQQVRPGLGCGRASGQGGLRPCILPHAGVSVPTRSRFLTGRPHADAVPRCACPSMHGLAVALVCGSQSRPIGRSRHHRDRPPACGPRPDLLLLLLLRCAVRCGACGAAGH
jgi:hypothetical protein